MYEMYPDWRPTASTDDEATGSARSSAAFAPGPVQESLDLRDHGGQRPDDD